MMFVKLLLLSLVLVLIAILALSVRMLFMKNGSFSGGSCNSSKELNERGISCGCGGSCQGSSS